jgi:hypothetical protein
MIPRPRYFIFGTIAVGVAGAGAHRTDSVGVGPLEGLGSNEGRAKPVGTRGSKAAKSPPVRLEKAQ